MSTLPLVEPPAAVVPPAEPAPAAPLVVPLTEPPDPPAPALVPAVVFVVCEADVFWLVVALGEMVTLLCGIALNCAFVLTVVFAFGFTD